MAAMCQMNHVGAQTEMHEHEDSHAEQGAERLPQDFTSKVRSAFQERLKFALAIRKEVC